MGFAGARCCVHLSDGRQIYVTQTRDQVSETLGRTSPRWPLVELHEVEGSRRFVAGAHIVELKSIDAEG